MTNKDGISVEGVVWRLRVIAAGDQGAHYDANFGTDLFTAAAALILALSEREAAKDAEIAALRDALERIAGMHEGWASERMALVRQRARAALTKGQVDAG